MQLLLTAETRKDREGKPNWWISKSPLFAFRIETTAKDNRVVKVYPKNDNQVDFTKPLFLGKVFDDGKFKFFGLEFRFVAEEKIGTLYVAIDKDAVSQPETTVAKDDIPY